MRLVVLWLLGGVPAALAQEVGPDPTSESPAKTAVETAPEAESERDAQVQAVDISVQLTNGMTLKGTAPLNEVMVWSKGSPLHFTPAGGVEVVLGAEKILQIFQGEAPVAAPVAPTAQEEAQAEMAKEWEDFVSPGGFGYPNPAASRYLYAPRPFPWNRARAMFLRSGPFQRLPMPPMTTSAC